MMTRQKMEELGHKVRGTYRGPLDWDLCLSLYNSLQQAKDADGNPVFPLGALRIVQQDRGFNIIEVSVLAPSPLTPADPILFVSENHSQTVDTHGITVL